MIGAGVAHELYNPMMGILNQIQYAMDRSQDEGPVKDVLEKALANVRRCEEIVESLLSFSRKDPDTDDFTALKGDMNAAVQHALAAVEDDLSMAGITVKVDLDGSFPQAALSQGRIEQILLNLIHNARHAMAECPRRELTLQTQDRENNVAVIVRDSGHGMDKETRSHVLDPFFSTKAPGAGIGLGLSLCNCMLDRAGGRICVDSAPNVGSTFTVLIPKANKGIACRAE